MAKVFISFLGTGLYEAVHYEIEGRRTEEKTQYIQEALLGLLYSDWTEEDRVLIFCTDYAYTGNWKSGTRFDKVKNQEVFNVGLEEVLDRLMSKGFNAKVECVEKIKEGFSIEDVWEIFNVVLKQLNVNDEVYFDITHAFRSIPFIGFGLFNYAQFILGSQLKAVHYGAFEKLKSDKTLEAAPIVDLSSMIELQQMTLAASDFNKYGKMDNLTSQLEAYGLLKLKEHLAKFQNNISACRIQELKNGSWIGQFLSEYKKQRKKGEVLEPLQKILDRIAFELNGFEKNISLRNVDMAVRWAYRYNMLQQAYTMGQELVIKIVSNYYKRLAKDLKNPLRPVEIESTISSMLGIATFDLDLYNFKPVDGVDIETLVGMERANAVVNSSKYEMATLIHEKLKMDQSGEWFEELRRCYKKLGDNRNCINHGKDGNYDMLHVAFAKDYEACMDVLKKNIPDAIC